MRLGLISWLRLRAKPTLIILTVSLVIDLIGVTEISAEGEEALYFLMVQGAKLRGGGVFVKQVLKQVVQRVRQDDSL